MMYACDAHITPSLFMDRLHRLGVELTHFDQSLIPIKTSKGDLIKRAKERGETLNITEDFLVQFLAYGNPDHSERGSQRLNQVVTYYQTMLHGMIDAGNFTPACCEFFTSNSLDSHNIYRFQVKWIPNSTNGER